MDPQRLPSSGARREATSRFWGLARSQHGVVTRTQLLELGMGPDSIKHWRKSGRLHPLWRGVYAVGRPEVSRKGRWMGAVLACGPGVLLSHRSAAVLWGLVRASGKGEIHVVIPRKAVRRRPGIRAHRRVGLGPEHRREVDGIPVTDVVSTLVDLASCVPEWRAEQAINEADRIDLIGVEALRDEVRTVAPRPGMACMRRLLGLDALTDTGLERKFLALARAAGLPSPETQAHVNGYRVDFHWPELGLVVETDGGGTHRTPGQRATDYRRDQAHAAAGLTPLRFAEHQIRHAPDEVKRRLRAVGGRLGPSLSGRRKHLG
jgi:very-short-patch-repair endonuclease